MSSSIEANKYVMYARACAQGLVNMCTTISAPKEQLLRRQRGGLLELGKEEGDLFPCVLDRICIHKTVEA